MAMDWLGMMLGLPGKIWKPVFLFANLATLHDVPYKSEESCSVKKE